jgi:hypothetical protein
MTIDIGSKIRSYYREYMQRCENDGCIIKEIFLTIFILVEWKIHSCGMKITLILKMSSLHVYGVFFYFLFTCTLFSRWVSKWMYNLQIFMLMVQINMSEPFVMAHLYSNIVNKMNIDLVYTNSTHVKNFSLILRGDVCRVYLFVPLKFTRMSIIEPWRFMVNQKIRGVHVLTQACVFIKYTIYLIQSIFAQRSALNFCSTK